MIAEHFIFIPCVALIGVALGYVLGASAVRKEIARQKKLAKK